MATRQREYNLTDKMSWGKHKNKTIKYIINFLQDVKYLQFLNDSKYNFKLSDSVIKYIRTGQE